MTGVVSATTTPTGNDDGFRRSDFDRARSEVLNGARRAWTNFCSSPITEGEPSVANSKTAVTATENFQKTTQSEQQKHGRPEKGTNLAEKLQHLVKAKIPGAVGPPIRAAKEGLDLVKIRCPSCADTVLYRLPDRRCLILCKAPGCGRIILKTEADETGRLRQMPEYFEGFKPLETDRDWMGIWLLQLARFRYDHEKIRLANSEWKSSAATWRSGTGICRDSATLLADWLWSCGYDARIVVGQLRNSKLPGGGGGHAWVVLVDRSTGKQFLLESTSMTQSARMRVPPLASLKIGEYTPKYQFVPTGYRCRATDLGETGEYESGWYHVPKSPVP